MTEPSPFHGAFPHQHHDPRGLVARIEAQIRERLEEAVEMAGLKLMVDLRAHHRLPAPETSSETDRKEFEAIAAALLAHLRDAFHAELGADERAAVAQAEAGASGERDRLLAGQVLLARRLPDYWQRFEAHAAAYATGRLEAPLAKSNWFGRLFNAGG
jgi:hypothetical protein